MDRDEVEAALLQAHQHNDVPSLITLYALAADEREQHGDIDAACFFLTHAFVFALESGSERMLELNQRLVAHGRSDEISGW